MAASKRSRGKQEKAMAQLIILAVYDKEAGLSTRELKALTEALQVAADESIQSHAMMRAVVVPVSEGS